MTQKHFKWIKFIIFIFLMIFIEKSYANENQYKLNGFWLNQYKSAVSNIFRQPIQSGERNGVKWEAYSIPKSKSYMVFEFFDKDPNIIKAIQITGESSDKLFLGLKLGDKRDKVIRVLGKPDEIRKVASMDLTFFDYKDKNYTVELDKNDRLYSIRIHSYPDLEVTNKDIDWKVFEQAIKKTNLSKLSEFFHPRAEIYRNSQVITINRPFELFFSKPDQEFLDSIFSLKQKSVLLALESDHPTEEIRIIDGVGSGWVYKFYSSKILEEIVFLPYGNKYRIYEIRFR